MFGFGISTGERSGRGARPLIRSSAKIGGSSFLILFRRRLGRSGFTGVRYVVYASAEITEQLTEAHPLKRRKAGLQVFYAIADPSVDQLGELVCGRLEKRLTEQAEAFGPR